MGLTHSSSSGNSYKSLDTPATSSSHFTYVEKKPSVIDLEISTALHIPPPTRPLDEHDSQKIYAFYRSRNLCCIPAFIILIIVCIVLGTSVDAGLGRGWSGQGANIFNDRHVPVSLFHKGTAHILESPSSVVSWNQTITSTPAIWGGRVFVTSKQGTLAAFEEHTGVLLWSKRICEDIHDLTEVECMTLVDVEKKYVSVATPTIWGDNVVFSIKQPPTLVVLTGDTGSLVSRAILDDNPRAELVQSGTVLDDSIYIGTSISDQNAYIDLEDGCTFVGKFFRWDLSNMKVVWSARFDDPKREFTGMRIAGSSPPISVQAGLVVVSVGPAICKPDWYQTCTHAWSEEPFDSTLYRSMGHNCHYVGTAKDALFNSIVLLDLETGSKVWWQKLIGYDAWSAACSIPEGSEPTCAQNTSVDEDEISCNIQNNLYLNCPSEEESWSSGFKGNDFVDDPVLTYPSNHVEMIYVAQTSGVVYSFYVSYFDIPIERGDDHLDWATSVIGGHGISGLAVDKFQVYVTLNNDDRKSWVFAQYNQSSTCGGWVALNRDTGVPVWYNSHPQYCVRSYTAPSVTNNLVLITSVVEDEIPSDHCVGFVHAVSTITGNIEAEYQNPDPFKNQGVAIHGRCAYIGSDGWDMLGWCITQSDLVDSNA